MCMFTYTYIYIITCIHIYSRIDIHINAHVELYTSSIRFFFNNRVLDDLAHHYLSYDRESLVQGRKTCYNVRVERGFFRSHNLTSDFTVSDMWLWDMWLLFKFIHRRLAVTIWIESHATWQTCHFESCDSELYTWDFTVTTWLESLKTRALPQHLSLARQGTVVLVSTNMTKFEYTLSTIHMDALHCRTIQHSDHFPPTTWSNLLCML